MTEKKDKRQVEFEGRMFEIAQPTGRCCESGCDGCELYRFKVDHGYPLQSSRMRYFENLGKKKS